MYVRVVKAVSFLGFSLVEAPPEGPTYQYQV
jgi:hypothetical protein